MISILKFTKQNYVGVVIVNLCTSSDNALYLYQVFTKYLKRFSKQLSRHDFHIKIFKGA